MEQVFKKYTSAAAEAKAENIVSGRSRLWLLQAGNKNAGVAYLWVFDAATAAGVPLITPVPIPANGWVNVPLHSAKGIPIATALSVALSSTFLTFTQLGTADGHFTVGYGGS